MEIICKKSRYSDDWFCIERANHPNIREEVPTKYGWTLKYSGRITEDQLSCVEGTAEEIQFLARRVLIGLGQTTFKRCSVKIEDDHAIFWSPRNSNGVSARIPLENAKSWAEKFLAGEYLDEYNISENS